MRVLPLCLVAVLMLGCAPPRSGVDWHAYTTQLEQLGYMSKKRYPQDAPVDADLLARNFERLAFVAEQDAATRNEHLTGPEHAHLRKWREAVVYRITELDDGETEFKRKVSRYLKRLHLLTGVEILPGKRKKDRAPGEPVPNLMIIYGPDLLMARLARLDRDRSGNQASAGSKTKDGTDARRAIFRSIADRIRKWRAAPSPCAGTAFVATQPKGDRVFGEIFGAIIYIRSEIPESLLDACVEEELAQVFGIMNDDASARPSIFNDDQEFALLTFHDELLLRILYDPRLRPGMKPEDAMPIVRRIARELRPGT